MDWQGVRKRRVRKLHSGQAACVKALHHEVALYVQGLGRSVCLEHSECILIYTVGMH